MEHRKKERNGKVKIRVYIRIEEEQTKNKMAIIEFSIHTWVVPEFSTDGWGMFFKPSMAWRRRFFVTLSQVEDSREGLRARDTFFAFLLSYEPNEK